MSLERKRKIFWKNVWNGEHMITEPTSSVQKSKGGHGHRPGRGTTF